MARALVAVQFALYTISVAAQNGNWTKYLLPGPGTCLDGSPGAYCKLARAGGCAWCGRSRERPASPSKHRTNPNQTDLRAPLVPVSNPTATFVIYHEGGGWCASDSNCYERSLGDLGSSKGYPDLPPNTLPNTVGYEALLCKCNGCVCKVLR